MGPPLMDSTHTVILMSGGIDSSSVTAACRGGGAQLSGIFVDYGQPAARSEWSATQNIAQHYGVAVRRVCLGFRLASHHGEFFARNALLILTAAGITEARPLQIALGVHALSQYYDTTPLFPEADAAGTEWLFRRLSHLEHPVPGRHQGRSDPVRQGQRRSFEPYL